MSGERPVTQSALESLTTDHYRHTEHPHLATLASESREKAIDLAAELREDPAIQELMKLVSWKTTYDITRQTETDAHVIARVILVEKRPGDREAALEIPDLQKPLTDVIKSGLELPFQFELVKEDGRWKIDEFTFPEILLPLLDMPVSADREE